MGFVVYNLLKFYEISEKPCCLQCEVGYLSNSTKPHVVSSQEAAGFSHTGLETARISKYKDLCIEGFHSQSTSTRSFIRKPSERLSQN